MEYVGVVILGVVLLKILREYFRNIYKWNLGNRRIAKINCSQLFPAIILILKCKRQLIHKRKYE